MENISAAAAIQTIVKKDDGLWKFDTLTGMASVLSFATIDQQILLSDIYRNVEF